MKAGVAALAACLAVGLAASGGEVRARALASIESRGAVVLCAHANALPFSSRRAFDAQGERQGFEIDIAHALAKGLGVALSVQWVVSPNQFRSADCDIVLDAIVDDEALDDLHVKASIPYQRSGVALALPAASDGTIRGVGDLRPGQRVAVQVGSLAAMLLDQRGIRAIPFGFEDEIEFIPISNMLSSVIDPWRDRRHAPWLEYGSLTCSPAPRSS